MKTKQHYLDKLVELAFKMDERAEYQRQKTKDFQHMSYLARSGLKESIEFKMLDMKYRNPTVTDYGDLLGELHKIVVKLKATN